MLAMIMSVLTGGRVSFKRAKKPLQNEMQGCVDRIAQDMAKMNAINNVDWANLVPQLHQSRVTMQRSSFKRAK